MRVVRSYNQYLIKSIATLVLLSIASASYAGGGLMQLVGLGSCKTPESCTPDSGASSSSGTVQTQSVNTGYAAKLKEAIKALENKPQNENYQRPQYIDYIPLEASGYLNP